LASGPHCRSVSDQSLRRRPERIIDIPYGAGAGGQRHWCRADALTHQYRYTTGCGFNDDQAERFESAWYN
jgi:hypothetical protein